MTHIEYTDPHTPEVKAAYPIPEQFASDIGKFVLDESAPPKGVAIHKDEAGSSVRYLTKQDPRFSIPVGDPHSRFHR